MKTMHGLLLQQKILTAAKCITSVGILAGAHSEANGAWRKDDRLCWPATLWYEIGDTVSPWPPAENDVAFKPVILDLVRYDWLARTGRLYDPAHTGRPKTPVVDNRKSVG